MTNDMKPQPPTESRVNARLEQGLLGHWYAVAKSVQVKANAPHAIKVLGQQLVLWRDTAGHVQCVEDYCPHRGARLSRGEVRPEGLACRYHGVTLDGTGTIVRVPAMPDCSLEGRKAIAGFETHEAADAVFIYVPSVEQPVAPPLVMADEFSDPEWESFLCMTRWDCNYRFIYDNMADPMHACYLHQESFTLGFGEKQDVMRLEKRADGFHIARVGQQNVNLDWTDIVVDGTQTYCRLDIPYPAAAGPGSAFRILAYSTPVDEKSSIAFFWRFRKVSGLARESWRFLYRATLESRHWSVLCQDQEMLESMPHDAFRREMLYQHDGGVTRLRQIMTRTAERQLAAEDASREAAE